MNDAAHFVVGSLLRTGVHPRMRDKLLVYHRLTAMAYRTEIGTVPSRNDHKEFDLNRRGDHSD